MGLDRRWWALIAICGGTFMLLVDLTIVQVALPRIQRELDASFTSLQWVIDAYALTLSALILTSGTLADRLGRKRVFLGGVAIFTLASLACGLSDGATALIAARAVQGIGGAAMFATSLALIAQEFEGPQRGTAIAAWGATVGGAVAVGPLVGGILTDGLGWQWIFFVNIPVGAATLAIAGTRMHNVKDPNARRLDWGGLVTFSGALFMLIFALLRGGEEGWGSTLIVGLLCGAAAMLAAFVALELRQERPMFDLSLFANRSFCGVSAATFLLGGGMFAMFPYLTLYLQDALGYSPLQGGLRLLPATLLTFVTPLATRRATARMAPAVPLAAGLGLTGLGIALMSGLTVHSTWTALLPGLLLTGVGIGLANPAIAHIGLGVVAPQRSGMASGISNTFRVGGLAIGVAALGVIFQSHLAASLQSSLGKPVPGLARAVASEGTRAASTGHAGLVQAALEAFTSSLNTILLIGAGAVLTGAALGAALVRARDFYRFPSVAHPASGRAQAPGEGERAEGAPSGYAETAEVTRS
ncbi:MAG TPA: MFS transporter [Solirubrobacteraceae bacterium]|nr:MFS transporter [Solirubrobacteraceae bacterium]